MKIYKMKIFGRNYKLLVLCLVIGITGCTNLDEEVFSEITEDSFLPSEEDLVALTASAYTPLRYIMGWQGLFDLQEESADIFVTPTRPNGWDDGGIYKRMHFHTWNDVQWQPRNTWISCFNGINNINRVISQIESGSLPIEDEQSDATIAEMRALRALYYSILIDTHGNVPILEDFSDEVPEQNSREEVFSFIIEELDEVTPLLSETVDQSTYGRMTKYGAYQIKARVYLNAEVYTGTPYWEEVISATDEIINSGKYSLDVNYKDTFVTNNQDSPEMVFSVPYDDIYATEWSQHMKMLPSAHRNVFDLRAQPWDGMSANPQFINTYQEGDQRLEDSWLMGDQLHATDGSVVMTIVNEMPSIDFCEYEEGYRSNKYQVEVGARASLSNDFAYFRYTDVLMMQAEALLRTGNSDAAADIVTAVRSRSFENEEQAIVTGAELEGDSKFEFGTLAEDGSIDEPGDQSPVKYGRFLDELGWEFVAEGRRRTDLIRFGVYQTKNWYNHTPQGDHTILFPIGLEELNTNTNLQQNPGY